MHCLPSIELNLVYVVYGKLSIATINYYRSIFRVAHLLSILAFFFFFFVTWFVLNIGE